MFNIIQCISFFQLLYRIIQICPKNYNYLLNRCYSYGWHEVELSNFYLRMWMDISLSDIKISKKKKWESFKDFFGV